VNALWSYFWPALGLGLLSGVIAGAFAFRRKPKRNALLAAGFAASIVLALLWHGPGGGADRFSAKVERSVHDLLVYYEMAQITAHLHHDPLTRRVMLSGTADDFQRSELVRLTDELPGVSGATWSADGGGVPLIAEGAAVSVAGFLLGLVLAYLVELRRRYNAQWNW
jgi:hypothetical protein